MAKTPNLQDAYALQSADGIKNLYQNWAHSYDTGFSEAEGYQLPREVVLAFIGAGGSGPVLDVGAGTGLVAERLAQADIGPIDALDLSQDMLEVARAKGCYRNLVVADVTQPLVMLSDEIYSGVISAGTFTLGHVGATGLDSLMSVASPACLFAITVNARHYESSEFSRKFSQMAPEISEFMTREVRIYDDRATPEHRQDRAIIATFRKA